MSLTWKDALTTLLAGGVITISYGMVNGLQWPLLTNWRVGVLSLFVLGMAMCTFSTPADPASPWTFLLAALGIMALILTITGLVFDSRSVFIALAVDILLLWFIATLRHFIVPAST